MSILDLRQLRYFAAVVSEHSIGRAALRLGVTQPAVSRQIKLLEHAVGAQLLARHAKGVEPTAAGQSLVGAARAILAQVDAAALGAIRAADGTGGTVRVGLGRGTLMAEIIQRGLALLHEQFPDIDLVIEDLESGPLQWRGLLDRSLDLAIGVEPPADLRTIAVERLNDATLATALVSSTHPLAARATLDPRALSPYPLLFVPRATHPPLYDALMAEIRRLGIESTVDDSHSGVYAMTLAVAAGRGWHPLPERYTRTAPDGTIAIPVDGLALPLWEAIMWRPDDLRPIVKRVLEVFRAARDGVRLSPSPRVETETRGLELHHLRALGALTEEAGWTRAAHRLGVAPSVLFRHIEELERELGLALFDRLPRGVRPTAAGASLAREAPRLLAAVDGAVADAVRTGRLHGRQCVLSGVDIMHASPVMRQVLRRCAERYPEIEIIMEELPTPDQCAALLDGEIDLGVGHLHHAVPLGIHRMRIASYLFDSALLAIGHPLAARSVLRPADLASFPFLFLAREAEPHFYDAVMLALTRAGFRPSRIQTFDSLHTARVVAMQGGGWTIGVHRHYTGLAAVRLAQLAVPSGLELLSRRDQQHPTVRILLDIAAEVVGERRRRAS